MKTIKFIWVMLFSIAVAACGGGESISATATTTAQSLTVGTAMDSFSPLTPSGGATPYTYSYTGTLPAGLSFSTSTGAVTETPTDTYESANLVFSVRDANNNYAITTSTVSFTVGAAVSISATATTTAQSLTVGTAMASFSPLTPSGGATPYTYTYTGTLPAGLSFSTSTGAVTGTPTATYAAANLVFSVRDANNIDAMTTSTVSFTVNAAVSISAIATTTPQSLPVGRAMTSFSPLTPSGGATPYAYSYTGTLPVGLSFSTSTGAVTGTPTEVYAIANLFFSVRDANNVIASTTSTVRFSAYVVVDALYVIQGGLTWMPTRADSIYNHAEASVLCAGTIDGRGGWRLPTQKELSALFESKAMNGQGWNLGTTWSSTSFAEGTHIWVNLRYRAAGPSPNATKYRATCVS